METRLDVAIVGGGVSGAYSAWRLQQTHGKELAIGLFEYGNRIGGRLFTVTLPGLPHVKAEVGGMRYIPTSHLMVANLVTRLGLATKDFPMGAGGKEGAKCNLFYLRGKHLRLHELDDPNKVPYNLAWSERGLGPTNLQVQAMNRIYPGFADLSLGDQMKVSAFGIPLWKQGFWNLMYRALSPEGYQFMKDAGGYEANVANANAVTQLPATEYTDTTQFLTLRDGYDTLPKTLVKEFAEMPDGKLDPSKRVSMNHRLAEIEKEAEGYTLRFAATETVNGKTCDVADSKPMIVRARKVILAMPRRSLELVKCPLFENEATQHDLSSVLIQSAFKLLMAFETPWWRALGLVAGRSVTDLPVRQIYYFGTEGEQEGGQPNMNSLLAASYNDMATVPFWKGLEKGEEYPGYTPACIEPEVKKVVPDHEFRVTDVMVQSACAQVAEVHALQEIPKPYSAVYHTWNEDPYGGGWHEWKADYRPDEIIPRIRKPLAEEDLYIVGEAYSYGQGWVEGALTVAESTLQDFFKLSWPRWLPTSYALLPGGPSNDGPCVETFGATDILNAATPDCLKNVEEG
ncbi:MAG: amine oxidoreductase [Chthonomonadales bacterium]|nr:amine oxidoreductase [Chthonomonadales bacterium]